MKQIFSALSLALIFSSCGQQQEASKEPAKTVLPSLESKDILTAVFEEGKFQNNEIVWKPDASNRKDFFEVISDDSLCHTQVDTTIMLGDKIFVAFKTDKYTKGRVEECHPCAPIIGFAEFVKTDKGYELMSVKKELFQIGSLGKRAPVTLDTIGGMPALKVSSYWMSTGEITEMENYFLLAPYKEIFSITTYESNGGMFEEGTPQFYEITRKVVNGKNAQFEVESTSVEYDSAAKKHLPKTSIDRYEYLSDKQEVKIKE